MGKSYAALDGEIREFLLAQRVFFVATAPLAESGLVNLSPKGLDSLRVLTPNRVAYVDHTGSGVETIAHLRENGRIVLMACAFEGPPRILRLHGKGRSVEPEAPGFSELIAHFSPAMPVRSVIVVDVLRIATSCGYGVPLFDFRGDRDQLVRWAEHQGEGLSDYQRRKNTESLDGLPGLRRLNP